MEEISNKMKVILIVLMIIPIILILFFVGLVKVNALELSDFINIDSFAAIESALNRNTSVLPQSDASQTQINVLAQNYENLNVNINNYKFMIVPIVYAYWFYNEKVCTWGPSNSGTNAFTAGSCQLVINNNISHRVVIYFNDGSIRYCSYDGALAVCNVEGKTQITRVSLEIYYSYGGIQLGSSTIAATYQEFQISSRLNRSWMRTNETITTNETNAIINKQDEMINMDIDNTSKQNVDETQYNDYKNKENQLMGYTSENNLSSLNIGIDANTSETIWQLITRIIQSNAKVFSLFISILSIGIIKIALAR